MNIDSTAYGVTENAADTDSLRVQLVENTQGSKLKAQLLGLVRTDDIADNAVTTGKLADEVQTQLANLKIIPINATGGEGTAQWCRVYVKDNALYIGTKPPTT
jgi:GTPase Era involved in 16S rRNA processing